MITYTILKLFLYEEQIFYQNAHNILSIKIQFNLTLS
jgi:hypothetical protein